MDPLPIGDLPVSRPTRPAELGKTHSGALVTIRLPASPAVAPIAAFGV